MKQISPKLRLLGHRLLILWFLLLATHAAAKDLRVPGNFASVDQAIRAADPSVDRIILSGDLAIANPIIVDKPIRIYSKPAGARVEVATTHGLVIRHGATSVLLEGITFSGSKGGIQVESACKLVLNQCNIKGNSEVGLQIGSDNSSVRSSDTRVTATLTGCHFDGNQSGLVVFGNINTVIKGRDSTFMNNKEYGVAIKSTAGNDISLNNCIIRKNTDDGFYIGSFQSNIMFEDGYVSATINNCDLSENLHGIHYKGLISSKLYGSKINICRNRFAGFCVDSSPVAKAFFSLVDSTISQNSHGVAVLGPVDLNMKSCSIIENEANGIIIWDYAYPALAYKNGKLIRKTNTIGFTMDGGQISNNKANGIQISHGGAYIFTNINISDNRGHGFYIWNEQNKRMPNDEKINLVMENIHLKSNLGSGIRQGGYTNLDLKLRASSVSENKGGIILSPLQGYYSLGNIISSRMSNKSPDIGVNGDFYIYLTENLRYFRGSYDNYIAYSPNIGLRLINSTLSSDPQKALSVKLNAKFGYIWNKRRLNKLDLKRILFIFRNKAQHINNDLSMIDLSFEDIEKSERKYAEGQILPFIGDIFAISRGKTRVSIANEAMTYFDKYPDSHLSCLLFQNLIGDVLSLQNDEHLSKFALIVNKYPDSAIANIICREIAMQSALLQTSNKNSFKKFRDSSRAATDSNAGNILSAILIDTVTTTITQEEKLNSINNTITHTKNMFPTLHEMNNDTTLSLNSLSDELRLCQAYRRNRIFCKLLGLAVAWHQLNQDDLSKRFFVWALRDRPMFEIGFQEPENIPYIIYDRYINGINIINKDKFYGVKAISATFKGEIQNKKILDRINSYRYCLINLKALKTDKILAKNVDFKGLEDKLFQLILNDIVDSTNYAVDPAIIGAHFNLLDGEINESFDQNEIVTALNWIDNAVGNLKKHQQAEIMFDLHMAQSYKRHNENMKEIKYLERLILTGKNEHSKYAYDRLTDLYLTFWQLPEKAIQVQRDQAKISEGTESEYEARLRIAKIYYENKSYSESIFELTKLIAKLPENYAKEPARTMLGLAYIGVGSYDEARNELAQVINVDQGEYREKCLYLTGYTYICEQKYQEAVKPFTDLIQLYPQSGYAAQAESFLKKITAVK